MKYLLTFLFLATALPASALPDIILNDPTRVTSYNLLIVYDDVQKRLFAPQSTSTGYFIVREEFVLEGATFNSPFLGILVGPQEKTLQRFGVSLPEKISTGQKVIYEIPAPYHPSAERIDIYKGAVKLFSIDVSGSRICVEDGMCMSDAGENDQNCSADCALVLPPPATPVKVQAPREVRPVTPGSLPPVAQSDRTSVENTGGLMPSLLLPLTFFGLGLMSFVVWVYLRKKARG